MTRHDVGKTLTWVGFMLGAGTVLYGCTAKDEPGSEAEAEAESEAESESESEAESEAESESEGETEVASLDDTALVALCEDFFDQVCMNATFAKECAKQCLDCSDPGVPGLMQTICASPITVENVQDCAAAARDEGKKAFATCQSGGGCMFDVGDVLCSKDGS